MARIYKVWPVPLLAQLTDEGEPSHMPDHVLVGGAEARRAVVKMYLDAGALTVHWQEYDRAGNALYPSDRVVESRAIKDAKTQERRQYRKQVRTTPQDIELPAVLEHEAESVAQLRSWPERFRAWWRSL